MYLSQTGGQLCLVCVAYFVRFFFFFFFSIWPGGGFDHDVRLSVVNMLSGVLANYVLYMPPIEY